MQHNTRLNPAGPVTQERSSTAAVFLVFLRLGLTSFGGPVAHLGYFRDEFVTRRQWVSESDYAELVALCQFLPGPASSQVGMALGLLRAGLWGAVAAWAGFTLPSAVALVLFALGLAGSDHAAAVTALHGLKVVAVAVLAQALWGMARQLCKSVLHISIMAVATCVVLWLPSAWGQVGALAGAGLAGLVWCQAQPEARHQPLPGGVSPRSGLVWLSLFAALLLGLPLCQALWPGSTLALVDAFFRAGSLVFGGGHVVLPLLQAEVVPPGWVDQDIFLAGYAAAQAVPGPLFTFAAFLGASMTGPPSGWLGGLIGLLAIFAPSFLLIVGVLPFWHGLRRHARMQAALSGIQAAVVGLLLAALYQPVWTSAIHQPKDFGLALVGFVALMFWRLPPWLVVLGCGLAGWAMQAAL